MDILKLKDSTSSELPRRVVSSVKTKTQFNYFRLSEDVNEHQRGEASSPTTTTMPKTSTVSSTFREEPLLIDLSPDPPVLSASNTLKPQPLYQQPIEPFVPLADQSRLYANYPSPTSPVAATPILPHAAESTYGSHFYSEVPIEPTTPTFTPPSSKGVSPARPIVTEELKKKRDEAFDWLGQALGELTLSKSSGSNQHNYDCITPISVQASVKPTTYGFEDNFSVAAEPSVHQIAASTSPNGYFRQQQLQRQNPNEIETSRQPFYPKPGIWTDEPSTRNNPPSASQVYALPGPSRMPVVQTAHVRPFMMTNPSAPSLEAVDGRQFSSILYQVQLSTPWASEPEIKQALVIHNGNVTEAVRFLQVEKLYR